MPVSAVPYITAPVLQPVAVAEGVYERRETVNALVYYSLRRGIAAVAAAGFI